MSDDLEQLREELWPAASCPLWCRAEHEPADAFEIANPSGLSHLWWSRRLDVANEQVAVVVEAYQDPDGNWSAPNISVQPADVAKGDGQLEQLTVSEATAVASALAEAIGQLRLLEYSWSPPGVSPGPDGSEGTGS